MPRRRGYDGDDDMLDNLDLPRLYESSSSPLLAGQDIPWRFTLDDHDHDNDDTLDLCSVFLNGTNLSRSGDASLLPFASPLCRGATPSLLETDAANRFVSVDVHDSTSTTAATVANSYTKMRRARESPSDHTTPSLHAMSLHDTKDPRQAHQQQHRHAHAQQQHLLSPRSFTAAVLGPSAASHMPLPTSHSGSSADRRIVTMPSEGAHLLTTSLHPSTAWGATHGSGHPTHPAWLAASLPSFSEGWTPSILPPSAAPQVQQDTSSSSSISSFEMPAAEWTPLEQLREAATRFADNEDGSQQRGSPQAHSPASSDASSTATVTPRTFAQETHQQPGPSNTPSSSRHQVSLPIRLPPPALTILSDPYADLSLHFMRHGLRSEAETLAAMPPDFILHNYLTIKGGPAAMFGGTEAFGVRHGREVRRQLGAAEAVASRRGDGGGSTAKGLADSLPESIVLDTQVLDADALRGGMLPTHLLVVLSSMPEKTTGTKGKAKAPAAGQQQSSTIDSNSNSSTHVVLPIHSLLYVLQCVSLPPLPPSSAAATPTPPDAISSSSSATAAALSETREFPIVPLRVPRPNLFHLTHRFIYSHDTQALLADLAPLERLSAVLREREEMKRGKGKGAAAQSGSNGNAGAGSSDQQVIMVAKPSKAECQHLLAAHVSAGELLEYAQRVHGAWANGVALGLTTGVYWRTLERAWDLVVGALLVQQKERERLGGHGGQGQDGTAGGMEGKAATAAAGNGRTAAVRKGKTPASRNRKSATAGHGSTKSASASEATSYKRQRRDGGQAEGSQTPRGTPVGAMRA